MAYKKAKVKTDLDVTGFLSVMSIVTGLICLILFVIALRIAMNPDAIKIVSFKLFTSCRAQPMGIKVPSYIDCKPDGLMLLPSKKAVSWEELQKTENSLTQMLDEIQAKREKEYVIVMVRPESVKFYRAVRRLVGQRPIDIGYDVIDADFKVDWDAQLRAMGF